MSSNPARLERQLDLLDRIAEIGVVLVERLRDHPPAPKQDVARDFDIITRSVRRSILLSLTIGSGKFAPSLPAASSPERDPAASEPRPSSDTERGDSPDRLDRLEDVSGPFEQTVASIVRDIQTVVDGLKAAPQAATPRDTRPDRPEANLAALE